ncbi:DUF5623 domain-containing protein [Pelagibacterium sp. 26DY04]|uniref:DUF5623 domain-containing protein n=1 Tax=unclassified Pelagibacterium TaxID=2623280 RepID=UPI002815D672|nr:MULTISPECIES: DUF5623 domain-containing protein [unclassified Pelagibacterium]WMT87052.1 DUF5623 domain-containing protein [Pelagibacterium sp. 26DY04]WMT91426.1 DUF5623 domain-containing protein [Pelagibacterium sp. H642]
MLIDDVRPTTLSGVKSLASEIRRRRGVKYFTALDLAAKAANCENFRHAQRTLPSGGSVLDRPYVLLTAYWRDRGGKYHVGRETLRIELSKEILDICGKAELKRVRGFEALRMVAADHFIRDMVLDSQEQARKSLCEAQRSLRFMEHTGLQPRPRKWKSYKEAIGKLPYSDHPTEWIEIKTGQMILVDEPYSIAPNSVERAEWAAKHGWDVKKSTWPGMYFPYNCDLYVASDVSNGYNLDHLLATIDAMPKPLVESDWSGESSNSWDTFTSPKAHTPQDLRRARPRGTIFPTATSTSVPYSFSMGTRRRRPKGALGVAGHIEAGSIIKAVMSSGQRPWGVYTRLNTLRSNLEDWMSLEIGPKELEGPEFFDVYYRATASDAPFEKAAATRQGVIDLLLTLKSILQAAYPDSAPLRREIKRVDMAVQLTKKMKL